MPIRYRKGDATRPSSLDVGPRIIIHIVNTQGGWGRGFVVALSKRWSEPEASYRRWHRAGVEGKTAFELGQIQVVPVRDEWESPLFVINMIAQEGYGPKNQDLHQDGVVNSKPPIRYDALDECLGRVAAHIGVDQGGCSVHLPKIGCGLGGGKWEEVEPLIQKNLPTTPVYVYDL